MQDDFEADSSERPDPELLAEDDLGGMMEASKTMDYDSDTSNDDPIDYEEEDERWEDERSEVDEPSQQVDDRDERNGPDDQPRRKRQKRDIPVLKDRKTAHENKQKILQSALKDIEKLIQSRKTEFEGGSRGLQSYCAQAIESYFRLVVRKKYKGIPASEAAAEAFGFARKWGGRQVRRWVRTWLNNRDLPESNRGCHIKVRSLLEDPAIRAELRTYVQSNKWAINPQKLQDFTNKTMLPTEAAKYCQEICDKEMPRGLKKYLELDVTISFYAYHIWTDPHFSHSNP